MDILQGGFVDILFILRVHINSTGMLQSRIQLLGLQNPVSVILKSFSITLLMLQRIVFKKCSVKTFILWLGWSCWKASGITSNSL